MVTARERASEMNLLNPPELLSTDGRLGHRMKFRGAGLTSESQVQRCYRLSWLVGALGLMQFLLPMLLARAPRTALQIIRGE